MDSDADFFEICSTAGLGLDYGDVPGAGTITGIGMIRGNLVMIVASDGTLKGGTSYPITVTKSLRAQVISPNTYTSIISVFIMSPTQYKILAGLVYYKLLFIFTT